MKKTLETQVEIVDIGSKGKTIGKKNGVTFLCNGGVPGDIVDLEIQRKRNGLKEGVIIRFIHFSQHRTEPKCLHFGDCGGCSWQNMSYDAQLKFKENRVPEQLRRISGLSNFESEPIIGCTSFYNYRNKLEFTFINQRWLTADEIKSRLPIQNREAIGFHVPGRFDKVLKVDHCELMHPLQDRMRSLVLESALKSGLTFDDPIRKTGDLRNIMFRVNRKGEWMVVLVVRDLNQVVRNLANELNANFNEIRSLWVIENQKVNDTYSNCPATLLNGDEGIIEELHRPNNEGSVAYQIGPQSFFQTNSNQAELLYQIIYQWADLKGHELVFDLYTGTGSIAMFIANKARHVLGIEYVEAAIEDAKINAIENRITNVDFFAGDMSKVLDKDFLAKHGIPDLIITDPPRAGMHADVVNQINESNAKRVIYVSCDPATQARDIKLMSDFYQLVKIQTIDMFPHTSHVENIALLQRR